jgi:predicted lipopolysaccharide heptosyltransferase III
MKRRNISELLNNMKNILIIQLGDIGDVVWSTPTLWAVKGACPGARVSMLLREDFGQLLEKEPSLHRTFEVRRHQGSLLRKALENIKFILDIRREHFDLVIDLRSDERGAYMTYISGAPIRVSSYFRDAPFWRNWVFTHVLDAPHDETTRGAAEQSLKLLRQMGIKAEDPVPRLWVSERNQERALEILHETGIPRETCWVSVNPFSRWSYKEWDHGKWSEIMDWLWHQFGMAAVIVGAKAEREKAEAMASRGRGSIFNLTGKTTLAELAGLLELSYLHLGVDSAAPHIAAAVGTPTITIYGPSNWKDWAPVGEKHRVIVPDLECVPCYKKGCDGTGWSRCLEELTVEKVQEGIRETLSSMKEFREA